MLTVQFDSDDENAKVVRFYPDNVIPLETDNIGVVSVDDDRWNVYYYSFPDWMREGMPVPAAPEIVIVDKDAVVQEATDIKGSLIDEATRKIDILTDRIELGLDRSDELKAWKLYRINLDDVDTHLAPDIEWPVSPEVALAES